MTERKATQLELDALKAIVEGGLPEGVPQYRFCPGRQFRFDRAWPDQYVALELEGGVTGGGWHNSAGGMLKDMEKYNAAAILGWTIIRAAHKHVDHGQMVQWLRWALEAGPLPETLTAYWKAQPKPKKRNKKPQRTGSNAGAS